MPPTASPLHEQFILAPPSLREVVRHFVLLTVADRAEPAVRTLLPNFQVVMLITLGGEAEMWQPRDGGLVEVYRREGIWLVGPLKKALQYRLAGGARVLTVNFTLGGFFRLFQVPVDRLQGEFIDPDDLMGHRHFAELWDRLQHLPYPAQIVQAIADFYLPYLRAPQKLQVELLAQLSLLTQSSHLNPLKVMASATKLSERTLQLRLQKYLGFSAKEMSRFLRFRRVLADLQQREGVMEKDDWFAFLEQYGYYDQSHLIHDFTHFLQQSPTKVAVQLLDGDVICFTKTELL